MAMNECLPPQTVTRSGHDNLIAASSLGGLLFNHSMGSQRRFAIGQISQSGRQ